jgi:hypothetical protein
MLKRKSAARNMTAFLCVVGVMAGCGPANDGDSKAEEQTKSANPALELISLRCESNGYNVFAIGEVRNISKTPLRSVAAAVDFRTRNGKVIKTAEALLNEKTVMPGETSAFSVPEGARPEIQKCDLKFKFLVGERIMHIDGHAKNPALVQNTK